MASPPVLLAFWNKTLYAFNGVAYKINPQVTFIFITDLSSLSLLLQILWVFFCFACLLQLVDSEERGKGTVVVIIIMILYLNFWFLGSVSGSGKSLNL